MMYQFYSISIAQLFSLMLNYLELNMKGGESDES